MPENHPSRGYVTEDGQPFGMFVLSGREAKGRALQIIASDGEETGWEHVSVSLPECRDKCPSWREMCAVKDLFWSEDESVIQFHPPASEYVNFHPGCLHLWRYTAAPFPLPPSILVGPKL